MEVLREAKRVHPDAWWWVKGDGWVDGTCKGYLGSNVYRKLQFFRFPEAYTVVAPLYVVAEVVSS